MKSYILITGGAGFIGHHLTRRLLAEGHDVKAVDNFSTGSRTNIETFLTHPRYTFIEGNCRDSAIMEKLIAGASVVYNLAASVGVQKIFNDPIECIENNTEIGSLVLKLCNKYKTRVFMFSTSEIYGKSAVLPFKEESDITIGAYDKLRWGYACSKVLDDYLARAYFEKHGLPVTIVRLFNTIGANQVGAYGMVVPRLMAQALANKPLTVFGDGNQSRCFTDVRDVVEALYQLIHNPRSIGELINIGGDREISILALAEKIIEHTGSSSSIELVPYGVAYGEGFEDMSRRVPSTQKLTEITGLRLRYTLEDTLTWIQQSMTEGKSLTNPALKAQAGITAHA